MSARAEPVEARAVTACLFSPFDRLRASGGRGSTRGASGGLGSAGASGEFMSARAELVEARAVTLYAPSPFDRLRASGGLGFTRGASGDFLSARAEPVEARAVTRGVSAPTRVRPTPRCRERADARPVTLDQRPLLGPRPPLELALHPERLVPLHELLRPDELHRPQRGRVSAERTTLVLGDPGLQIVRMSHVEAAIAALEHVHEERLHSRVSSSTKTRSKVQASLTPSPSPPTDPRSARRSRPRTRRGSW